MTGSTRFNTLAVHAGERAPRPDFTPVSTPIYHSVAYQYDSAETLDAVFGNARDGYVYQRYGSPTVHAFEDAVAALEGGEAAMAFGSGMGAIHATLLAAGARAGAALVVAQDCYGATHSIAGRLLATQGVRTVFVDITDAAAVERALGDVRPAALFMETVSNPLVKVADVPTLTAMAHAAGALVIVDNTFSTPCLFRPLAVGVDYVAHSATKYLGGHGDAMGGVVVTSAARRAELKELAKMLGSTLGPQEAWLLHRGLKTLPLRFRQQCANAQVVAEWLAQHPRVAQVHYPGLPAHRQHDLATQLFGGQGYGGMLSFEMRDGTQAAVFRFLEALRLVIPATTLGDVYSLALYPAMSSHRALPPEERRRIGIGDGLVRLSIGIEDAADIIADVAQALAA